MERRSRSNFTTLMTHANYVVMIIYRVLKVAEDG